MICPRERTLVLSGIGGQGIQLAAQVIARAAVASGLEVQLFGSYGGMMRGGNTEATVVISERPVESPPTVTDASEGIVMHHEHAEATLRRLAPDALVLVNSTVYEGSPVPGRRVDVAATAIAADLGNPMVASMVMVGAYAAATSAVALDALVAAVAGALPSYRSDRARLNADALRAGHDAGTAACLV